MRVVRCLLVSALLATLAGCPASVGRETLDTGGDGSGSNGDGAGQNVPAECTLDTDCVPAGPKCCDCPTHAVPKTDPTQQACANVDCGPLSCDPPREAICNSGRCVLSCAPIACDPSISCSEGFAADENGCLTCTCATAGVFVSCTADTECVRVRADCCGCPMGGSDTAILKTEQAQWDASLMCPAEPSCPGTDTCAPDLEIKCDRGACALLEAAPANACGRTDLPACPEGESCYVNANDQATMHGVGVCQP